MSKQIAVDNANKQLEMELIDELKFNEVVANVEPVDEEKPQFWITHINYDIDQLMKDFEWNLWLFALYNYLCYFLQFIHLYISQKDNNFLV